MDQQPQNPQAFPVPGLRADGEAQWPQPGMSLRDYFAGAAISGLMAAGFTQPEVVARYAYEQADALLAERVK